MLPSWIRRRFVTAIHNRGLPFMLYFHPSDIDTIHLKIDLSVKETFFNDVGRRSARQKIIAFMEDFEWTSVREAFARHLSE